MNNKNAKKYNNIKLYISITKGVVSFFAIIAFVYFGYSNELESYLKSYTENQYLLLLLFVVVVGFVSSVINFPVKFYTEFYLEHKYELSNQTFWKWIWEDFKGLLVGLVIGVPILLLFYWVMLTFGDLWWLVFSIAMFLISVVLAQIVPVVILPIFYKITPLENEEIKNRVLRLAADVKMKVENVFQFNMSKNTKKANAAFTGLGRTKRIILGDTLLDNYTEDEIETVLAHEFGHYKHKHIIKNLFIGTATSFLTFFIMAKLYDLSLPWFGFTEITQVSALPILSVWAMLIGLISTPLGNMLSRKFEYQADEYAIQVTGKPEAFINTLEKLTDQNLGDKEPHPFVEWFFYSHPSVEKRRERIEKSVENNKGLYSNG
ncbi:Peptidase, M48 family [hydrothermal vent metagenome]|uniref:Peptidase, M48 family n=1 Tax=hydrothermal vent metagenome TaxID=652676 RepID=A0A3B1CUK5_9ZZZZ